MSAVHELSVCQRLLAQVEAVAASHGARAVRRVRLRIGPLSGVEPSLLRNAYPLAVVGTVAEDSELLIERAPVTVRCEACGEEAEVTANRLACPVCGASTTRLLSGDELLLVSLDLVT